MTSPILDHFSIIGFDNILCDFVSFWTLWKNQEIQDGRQFELMT